MGEDRLDDLEVDGPITLRILDGIAWDYTQAKWWMWWKTVKCGGLISSCCPRNPQGKSGDWERRREAEYRTKIFVFVFTKANFYISVQTQIKYVTKMLQWLNNNWLLAIDNKQLSHLSPWLCVAFWFISESNKNSNLAFNVRATNCVDME